MGKRPTYVAPNTIEHIRVEKGHRVGDCSVCGRRRIRSKKWAKHEHVDQEEGHRRNAILLEDFMREMIKLMEQKAMKFLLRYPQGVPNKAWLQFKTKAVSEVLEGTKTEAEFHEGLLSPLYH